MARVEELLGDGLLERVRARAAGYDAANSFCHEDLAELQAAGYLKMFVPAEWGGSGCRLQDASRAQLRLAAAPATALAVNMHLVWTGVARVLQARGDRSLGFVLREAGQGEIFGFGVSEAGNDQVLLDSRTVAAPREDGGYSGRRRNTPSRMTGTPWACGPASPAPRCWRARRLPRPGYSASCRSARTPTP